MIKCNTLEQPAFDAVPERKNYDKLPLLDFWIIVRESENTTLWSGNSFCWPW